MRWDRFFEDLEDQLDSEWEAERVALDTEAERLRMAHRTLRERLLTLASTEAPPMVGVEVAGGHLIRGRLAGVGADWAAIEGDGPGATIIPFATHPMWTLSHGDILASVRQSTPARPLADRMTFGFVVRDLVRRRVCVRVRTAGHTWTGTMDRAGADHLDLALHEPGEPRRAGAVTGYRILPFDAVGAVSWDSAVSLLPA